MSEPGQGREAAPEKRLSPVLYLLIFTAGMSFSLLGAALPDVSLLFDLSKSQASSLPLAQFSGDFAGLLLLGLTLSRARHLLYGSALALCAAGVLISLAPGFSMWLKVWFFLFGAASGILITLPGMISARVAAGQAARSMNLLYAFFSAGVMTAPIGSGVLVELGLHFREAFLALSGLALVAGVAAAFSRMPIPELGQGLYPTAMRDLVKDHRGILAVVIVMNLCYVGAEAVPNAWIPKYLQDTFPGRSELGSAAVLSLFWGAITGGRFLCAALLKKGVRPRALLAGLAALSCATLAAAPMAGSLMAAQALFVASGLFFSGMFPVIISHTEHIPERSSGTMFIMVMAAGMLGASAAGKSVGVIADAVSFPAGMGLAALLSAGVLFLIPLLSRQSRGGEEFEGV